MRNIGIILLIVFSVSMGLLVGKGCDLSWVGVWWSGKAVMLNTTPEGNIIEETRKAQEELLAAGPREEIQKLREEQKRTGKPLSLAQMQRLSDLEKKAEEARGAAEKWAGIEPVLEAFRPAPKWTEGPQVRENADGSVTIFLPANVSWYDTGVDLDGPFTIQAKGDINFGMPRTNGPAGYQGMIATWGESPLLGAPNGALIGKIGQDGQPFLIGAYLEGEKSGRLFLTINDGSRDLGDNRGSFKVTVK